MLVSFDCAKCGSTKYLYEQLLKKNRKFEFKKVNGGEDVLKMAAEKGVAAPFFTDGVKFSRNLADFTKKRRATRRKKSGGKNGKD